MPATAPLPNRAPLAGARTGVGTAVTAELERRARQVRARATLRAWEFRQRHQAKGVWFRLRRVLVDASAAYEVEEITADELVRDGLREEPVGHEIIPTKRIFFVSLERLARITDRREIPLRLGPELLCARSLVLVGPFGPLSASSPDER